MRTSLGNVQDVIIGPKGFRCFGRMGGRAVKEGREGYGEELGE